MKDNGFHIVSDLPALPVGNILALIPLPDRSYLPTVEIAKGAVCKLYAP